MNNVLRSHRRATDEMQLFSCIFFTPDPVRCSVAGTTLCTGWHNNGEKNTQIYITRQFDIRTRVAIPGGLELTIYALPFKGLFTSIDFPWLFK